MFGRVAILAIAALVALPAVAGAAVKHKVKKSPDEVRAYWTKERMKNAKPLKVERTAGKAKPGPSTSWSSFEAPLSSGGYTDRRHGKVFFSDGPSNYVCSGTALRGANGRSVVWTAGHCVVEGGGDAAANVNDEYQNWAFVPAYRDGATPDGTFAATSLSYAQDWDRQLEYGHDFAAATVAPNEAGETLEAAIGRSGFGLAVNYASPTETTTIGRMRSHGYPAAGAFNGERQNVCSSYVTRRDSMGAPPTMAIGCDSTGGSSGGSWIIDAGTAEERVASVNSYGYGHLRNTMFGPAQDSEATAVYTAALAG